MGSGVSDESERIHNKRIDIAINESATIAKLLTGNSDKAEVVLDGRNLTAQTQSYQDHGSRKVFTLFDATTRELIAYLDVGLDQTKHTATCKDRSLKLPADEATLKTMRTMGSCGEGFAVETGNAEAGNLLMGLAIYTLTLEGCGTLEMCEYVPYTDDGVYSDTGTQRANFKSKYYHGVTPEIRDLTAKALKISID